MTQAWQDWLAETKAMGARADAAFQKAGRLAAEQAARHHPDTGGHFGLVHNWGNDAAKAAVARCYDRWRIIGNYRQRVYSAGHKRAVASLRGC